MPEPTPSRPSRSRILRGLTIGFVVWLVFAAWLLGTAWRQVPHYEPEGSVDLVGEVMGASGYEAVIETHERPFVYEISSKDGAVLVYGSEHTRKPDDPQIRDMTERWETFEPTLALVESDLGTLFPVFMDPVETFGEVGWIHSLAREARVPTYTWEPTNERLVSSLLGQGFTAREVAASLILRPYFSNLRHGRPEDPEGFVEEYRAERVEWPGLDGTFSSVADLDTYWTSRFPDGPDWRDVSDEFGLPGFLGLMDANRARDEHFVRVVVDLVRRGERVFAIAGSSHAVKIEAALQQSLNG